MPTALCVTAPLLLAAVLVVSAIGKLRSPERSRAAFTAMGVPAWLDRPGVARAHPWGEIALAVLLLLTPAPVGVVVAVAALLLMLVYVVLVVRALRSPVDVDCACFGSLGSDRVTGVTVWRNVWLIAIASSAFWCSFEERSVLSRLAVLPAGEVWWLVAVGAAALTVGLVMGTGRTANVQGIPQEMVSAEELEDYVRSPTPAVPVLLADGSETDLRALSKRRAQLLVFVSETCGSCTQVIEMIPTWRSAMPELDLRLVVGQGPESSSLTSLDQPQTLHDVRRSLRDSFAVQGTPAALLLGADGFLAGGPVSGATLVADFVAEVQSELAAAGAI